MRLLYFAARCCGCSCRLTRENAVLRALLRSTDQQAGDRNHTSTNSSGGSGSSPMRHNACSRRHSSSTSAVSATSRWRLGRDGRGPVFSTLRSHSVAGCWYFRAAATAAAGACRDAAEAAGMPRGPGGAELPRGGSTALPSSQAASLGSSSLSSADLPLSPRERKLLLQQQNSGEFQQQKTLQEELSEALVLRSGNSHVSPAPTASNPPAGSCASGRFSGSCSTCCTTGCTCGGFSSASWESSKQDKNAVERQRRVSKGWGLLLLLLLLLLVLLLLLAAVPDAWLDGNGTAGSLPCRGLAGLVKSGEASRYPLRWGPVGLQKLLFRVTATCREAASGAEDDAEAALQQHIEAFAHAATGAASPS